MTKRWLQLKSFLSKLSWLERIWLLMPVFIWISYLPRISLGGDATMNYELSLTLIYVVVLAMVGLPTIWRHRKTLLRSKHIWILTAFLLWSLLSIIWSPNRLRGVLTGGILGLVYLIFLAAWAERVRLRQLLPTLAKLLVGSAAVASILALIQMVVGTYIIIGTYSNCLLLLNYSSAQLADGINFYSTTDYIGTNVVARGNLCLRYRHGSFMADGSWSMASQANDG